MSGMHADVRFGVRLLARKPGFTLTSIVTLVLGVVLNTAAFGIVNALWFGKLPFTNDREIVVVRVSNPGLGMSGLSWSDCSAASQASSFAGTAAFSGRTYNLSLPIAGAMPEQVSGGMMSASTLNVLGYTPILGRGFRPEDDGSYDAATGPPYVLISEALWRHRFAADQRVIGRSIRLDGAPATIAGVLPQSFRFVYGGYQVIAPLARDVLRAPRTDRSLQVLARLRPGIGIEQVNAELQTVSARLNLADHSAGVMRAAFFRDAVFAEAMRMYPILLAGAALVLLLVCANLSNLLLAETVARTREVATRVALGATRTRIVRQLLTEDLLVAAAGAGTALFAAFWTSRILVAKVPELSAFRVDWRVALYTLAAGSIAAVLFGIPPALQATRGDVAETVKSGAVFFSVSGNRFRNVMIAAQIAFALVLLSATSVLIRTAVNLRNVNTGMNLDGTVATTIQLRGARYSKPTEQLRFWEQLVERVAAQRGIESAGLAAAVPLTNLPAPEPVEIEGRPFRTGQDGLNTVHSVVDSTYMTTVRHGIVAGRGFTKSDAANTQGVAIVNEAFARQLWPANPPAAIGHRIRSGPGNEWLTIVAVAKNARQFLVFPPAAEWMTPVAQSPKPSMSLIVRAPAVPPEVVKQIVLREIRSLDPDVPAGEFLTADSIVAMFYPKVMIAGLGILSAVAVSLAALGVYGVVSFIAGARTHEIGMRMALGATPASILRLVLYGGFRTVAAGAAVGVAGAVALARVLRSLLSQIISVDPMVFIIVAVIMLGIGVLAMLHPAVRACRIDPSRALHSD